MLWIKTFHIVFMVAWFAGLFYLPRLYVYHAGAQDEVSIARFQIMERRLFFGIMTPAAVLTVLSGAWLWLGYGVGGSWLLWKLALVTLVIAHHVWCYLRLRDFARGENRHSAGYYRWMNEAPVVLLVAIVALAVVKPAL